MCGRAAAGLQHVHRTVAGHHDRSRRPGRIAAEAVRVGQVSGGDRHRQEALGCVAGGRLCARARAPQAQSERRRQGGFRGVGQPGWRLEGDRELRYRHDRGQHEQRRCSRAKGRGRRRQFLRGSLSARARRVGAQQSAAGRRRVRQGRRAQSADGLRPLRGGHGVLQGEEGRSDGGLLREFPQAGAECAGEAGRAVDHENDSGAARQGRSALARVSARNRASPEIRRGIRPPAPGMPPLRPTAARRPRQARAPSAAPPPAPSLPRRAH